MPIDFGFLIGDKYNKWLIVNTAARIISLGMDVILGKGSKLVDKQGCVEHKNDSFVLATF